MPPDSISIRLQGRAAACAAICRRELSAGLEQILECFGLRGKGCDLLLADDRSLRELNRAYLGLDGPTNVLSFPEAGKDSEGHLGNICLSVETLFREALLYGQDPAEHLIRLLCHGVLHLAGHEHGPAMQALTEQGLQVFRDRPERHLILGGS